MFMNVKKKDLTPNPSPSPVERGTATHSPWLCNHSL